MASNGRRRLDETAVFGPALLLAAACLGDTRYSCETPRNTQVMTRAATASRTLALDRWTYTQVDAQRAGRAFGLAAGDLTGSGRTDIVSGPYSYRNPGGDLTGSWTRTLIKDDVDAMLAVDVNGNGRADVIATRLPDVYWLEAADATASSWSAHTIGTIPKTDHGNGQGYATAQIVAGGKPEIVLAGGDGLYYFEIPAQPGTTPWPRVHITAEAADEGIGTGDVDGDGDVDVCAATGARGVAWWENPGGDTGSWAKHLIGTTTQRGDRFAMGDINRDGRLDIIVSEETSLDDASVYWFGQPGDARNPSWPRHTIVTQHTTNSMDVADMDRDGDLDIITGEHRGTKKLAVWENAGNGSAWIEHVVSAGTESHLGARVWDLDGDGDLDIVSIAWDDYQYLHVWRNDARRPPP